MFGNLGMGEILIIALIILVFFGARRIPELMGSMGKGIREFKRNVNEIGSAVHEPVIDDRPATPTRLPNADAQPAKSEEPAREPKRLLS